MARVIAKLSAVSVGRLAVPGYHSDGAGLYLQVSPSGSKSWIFRFTRDKKQREMGLGPLHTVTLSEARTKAKDCRAMLLEGKDPLAVRAAAKVGIELERAKTMTFDECAAAYIAVHRTGWKSTKHASQWESTISTYASSIIGFLPVAEVDTALVVKVLNPIWHAKTETATRLRGRIESILDWATVSNFRVGENPARWRGHLDNLLAAPAKIAKVDHHAALPWAQIGKFVRRVRSAEGYGARALEFAILTAARSGEVRGATWNEIDIEAALWTIPAERMKAGVEHQVPLAPAVIEMLCALPRSGTFLFPGQREGRPLSDMSLTAVLRRLDRGDITVHGFRSTFRDWCAEAVGNTYPREVCEHALAHRLPDKVEAAYRRGTLLDKRVMLMSDWANFCASSK